MLNVALMLIAFPVVMVLYSYVLYPALLAVAGLVRRPRPQAAALEPLPSVSITVPVYNERRQVRDTVEALLKIDYPRDRLQILMVSDASSDGTDEIIAEYADRGVELFRMPERAGKTAAENAARVHLRGDFIVNTDASIRLAPDAVRHLIATFADPTVGVATGRDVSMAHVESSANVGEVGYVGYEMAVRDLETRVHGIVGASGSLYAIRAHLHQYALPDGMSRDFSAALTAQLHGYRAVSVKEAVCYVPRTPSLRREYNRKVRTVTRGLDTLFYRRVLLNPLRHGIFSWMLFSHKLCRWIVPWALVSGVAGAVLLGFAHPLGPWVTAATVLGLTVAAAGWTWPEGREPPRLLAVAAYLVAGNVAVIHAWLRSIQGKHNPIWEPTRREAPHAAAT